MKKVIKIILTIIFLLIFIYSGYKIYSNLKQENENQEVNNKLVEKVIKENTDNTSTPIEVDFSKIPEETRK